MKLTLPVVVTLVLLLLLGGACGSSAIGVLRELRDNQGLWNDQGIDSYRYQLKVLCFCPPDITSPVTVDVHRGNAAEIRYVETGLLADPTNFESADTIDKVFRIVQDAIDRKAHKLTVTYNEDLGYPQRIEIDYIEQAVDEEITYEISDFMERS